MMLKTIKFHIKIILPCIIVTTSSQLAAMTKPSAHTPLEKKDKFFSQKEIVLRLAATHYIIDHEAICAFAETSKDNNALMVSTAQTRRRNHLKYRCPDSNPFGNFLHKYGSACYFAYQSYGLNNLIFGGWKLENENIKSRLKKFHSLISTLPGNPTTFFDEKENMYFYGYGTHEYDHANDPCHKKSITTVMQYCSDGSVMPCAIQVKDKNLWRIEGLLSYPNLLNTVLNTDGKKIIVADTHFSIPHLAFCFDDVIIPDNYKERIEFLPKDQKTKQFFDNFPDYIKEAINLRYLNQKNKGQET